MTSREQHTIAAAKQQEPREHREHPAVRERGYLNVYSELTLQERRQLAYVRRYKQEHPGWDATMIIAERSFAEMARRLHARGQPVVLLDAGCGRGNYCLDEHRTLVDRAIGVDADAGAVQGNRSVDELRIAPLTALPLAGASCTLVTCLWVLEHLDTPQAAFREFARVLQPGGYFLAVTPNTVSALVLLRRLLHARRPVEALNLLLYGRQTKDVFPAWYRANTIRTLQRLLVQAGFTDIVIRRNFDPGYTSFNRITYWLTRLSAYLPSVLSAPHLIATAKKHA